MPQTEVKFCHPPRRLCPLGGAVYPHPTPIHPKSQHNTHTALFASGPRPVLSYTAVGLVPPQAPYSPHPFLFNIFLKLKLAVASSNHSSSGSHARHAEREHASSAPPFHWLPAERGAAARCSAGAHRFFWLCGHL
eukprot:scaffold9060_cov123-Isochrysis_galbana.AAC.2